MSGRVEGKVAFITGAARGQGRMHAVRLAEEGADIIAVDLCESVGSVPYDLGTVDDLAETASLVEACGRHVVARQADVRDIDSLERVVAEGVAEIGHLDVVCANAGIISYASVVDIGEQAWQDVIDINLTGVWHTLKAAVPHVAAGGRGGSLIVTSSTAGLKGVANCGHYAAAKHGMVGLMKTLANELAPQGIRVNSVHPTTVDTGMVDNESTYHLFVPDAEHPTKEQTAEAARTINLLSVPWVETIDIANAVLFLASDEARYITGITLPIDAGLLAK